MNRQNPMHCYCSAQCILQHCLLSASNQNKVNRNTSFSTIQRKSIVLIHTIKTNELCVHIHMPMRSIVWSFSGFGHYSNGPSARTHTHRPHLHVLHLQYTHTAHPNQTEVRADSKTPNSQKKNHRSQIECRPMSCHT